MSPFVAEQVPTHNSTHSGSVLVIPSSDLAAPASLVSRWKVKSRKIDTVEVWGRLSRHEDESRPLKHRKFKISRHGQPRLNDRYFFQATSRENMQKKPLLLAGGCCGNIAESGCEVVYQRWQLLQYG